MRRAWVLNFGAERELESRAGRWAPSNAMRERFAGVEARLGGLVGARDIVLRDGSALDAPEGLVGDAWCPTPSALDQMARAGVEVPAAPPLSVLRRVNHRAFAAALGQTLPGAAWVASVEAAEEIVATPAPWGEWLLKRPFGFAGRGRRKVHEGALSPHDRAWVTASLTSGDGLQIEPWVERAGDFALHGRVDATGRASYGRVTRQTCDPHGAWQATALADANDLDAREAQALFASAAVVARALAREGYFGPFGIDAFRWRTPQGRVSFNARCEVNARYSMGWATGMRAAGTDLDVAVSSPACTSREAENRSTQRTR